MIDFKPRIKVSMSKYDRVNWMNEIKAGINALKLSHRNGIISDKSYSEWLLLRGAELAWHEFYMSCISKQVDVVTRLGESAISKEQIKGIISEINVTTNQ